MGVVNQIIVNIRVDIGFNNQMIYITLLSIQLLSRKFILLSLLLFFHCWRTSPRVSYCSRNAS